MSSDSTIVALSTAPGIGALAVIRLSGPQALNIVNNLVQNNQLPRTREPQIRTLRNKDEIVDEVIIIYFAKPNSYTGEDLIEISCHGSPYIINRIIQLCIDWGRFWRCRRIYQAAFINGKIDLSQPKRSPTWFFLKQELLTTSLLKR
jgi:tRNA modification GTPase